MTAPVFIEPYAGTAAVSLALQLGLSQRTRPLLARLGNKSGYAWALLELLGLRPGGGAAGYLWAEADPAMRLLLASMTQPELLMQAAALLRGWAVDGEAPRARWQRLLLARRAAPLAVPADLLAGGWCCDPQLLAGVLQVLGANKLITLDSNTWSNAGRGGTTFGGDFGLSADQVARRVEALAAQLVLDHWSYGGKGARAGYGGPGSVVNTDRSNWTTEQRDRALGLPRLSGRVEGMASVWPVSRILADAAQVPAIIEGGGLPLVALADPPYRGRTGYGAADHGRQQVLGVLAGLDAAGALVACCEEEPVLGWCDAAWVVDITGCRHGAKRSKSAQQTEIVSMNRAPTMLPAGAVLVQSPLASRPLTIARRDSPQIGMFQCQ